MPGATSSATAPTTPESLVERQRAAWDPLLAWAEQHYGARLIATEGVMPVDQPPESLAALRTALGQFDAFALTALHVMTTLTGSAVLALAHAAGRLSLEESWAAAHVDEDFQTGQWGEDARSAQTPRAALCRHARRLGIFPTQPQRPISDRQ